MRTKHKESKVIKEHSHVHHHRDNYHRRRVRLDQMMR
jgi:hypothetical protein